MNVTDLKPRIDNKERPKHVAIVMDGNGRWARKRLMPRKVGHKAGVKTLKNIVDYTARQGIQALTVFAFSSENWQRPEDEVSTLMDLFVSAIKSYLDELHQAKVRLRFIGDRSVFSTNLQQSLSQAEQLTQGNQGLQLNVAINYGGRWDITHAAQQIAKRVQQGDLQPAEINEQLMSNYLSMHELGDVDLFIRTGGEQRISNFLLWQSAYSELYFTDVLWPDFDTQAFDTALDWFVGRQRRFGRTGDQVEQHSSGQ